MTVRTATTVAIPAETYQDDVYQARDGRKARFHRNHAVELPTLGYYTTATTFRGDGSTVTAARADLAAKLATFLTDHRRPVILRLNGWTVILAAGFDLGGPVIESTMLSPDDTRSNPYPQSRGGYDWADEIRRAKRHLAQCGTRDYHDDDSVLETLRWLDDEDLGRDFLDDVTWQRAYRHAETIGEADPHRWATWEKRTGFRPDLPNKPVKEAS